MSLAFPHGVVAVVRADSSDDAAMIGEAMAAAGVDAVEITYTVPDAGRVIRMLRARVDIPVGAGTVTTAAEGRSAVLSGAQFIVSPSVEEAVISEAHSEGLPVAAGALTPTEIARARRLGADVIKVFPIDAVGGPAYLASLNGPFPGTSWMVSGGIRSVELAEYRRMGCHCVCMGSALIDDDAVRTRDRQRLTDYAHRVLATADAAAAAHSQQERQEQEGVRE